MKKSWALLNRKHYRWASMLLETVCPNQQHHHNQFYSNRFRWVAGEINLLEASILVWKKGNYSKCFQWNIYLSMTTEHIPWPICRLWVRLIRCSTKTVVSHFWEHGISRESDMEVLWKYRSLFSVNKKKIKHVLSSILLFRSVFCCFNSNVILNTHFICGKWIKFNLR